MPSVNQVPKMLRTWGVSEIGHTRTCNQDSGFFNDRFAIVADGVGGSAAGDIASATIVQQLAKSLAQLDIANQPAAEVVQQITAAIGQSNRVLQQVGTADPELAGMATTLSGLALVGRGVLTFHIGDSRIYHSRGAQLTQLTHDQTFVQMLLDQGLLAQDESHEHPLRNMLLHCLTGAPTDLDHLAWQAMGVRVGDRFALVSDGVSSYVAEAELQDALSLESPQAAARQLADRAVPISKDNVTVIVAEVAPAAEHDRTGTLIGAAAGLAANRPTNDDDGQISAAG